uniref:Integrase catalytic domain-containing protein n=1 Tax=Panagrolaimus superbus TaxID=310955 RepID=A0A914Y3N5_9BILA
MKSTDSAATIKALQTIFNNFGYCKTIVSDNGPQLVSNEIKEYYASKQIHLMPSPPYHPQSNGLAERMVGTAKKSATKILAANPKMTPEAAIQQFLDDYRATPHKTTKRSPNELMFCTPPTHLLSTFVPRKDTENEPKPRPTKSKLNFAPGDLVWKRAFRKKVKWEAGTVVQRESNYIYVIQDDWGSNSHKLK